VSAQEVLIAGAGASGLMAAIRAAQLGAKVTLLEKNPSVGRKLLLSGKGRCNLTNACSLDEFLEHFSGNSDFLRSAFHKFFNQELIDFFKERGLGCRVERQERVFPVTDSAASISGLLGKELERLKVRLLFKKTLKQVRVSGGAVEGVLLDDGTSIPCRRLILATGGASYSYTGSTGDGQQICQRLGHKVVGLRPGLVPLIIREKLNLQGLTLKNIRLTFSNGKKKALSDIGELLFTSSGISGPLVLTFSGRVVDWLAEGTKAWVDVDLKPALSTEQLEARLLREFKQGPKKALKSVIKGLVPLRLAGYLAKAAGVDPDKQVSQATAGERGKIIGFLKSWRLEIASALPLEHAMVTRGGVSLKEIDPRTMESRLVKGLYFCGELIDIDADTGGFNLQAAFSTGYLAGESASLQKRE
jgi:predicted Rossmann fold flavoprotein